MVATSSVLAVLAATVSLVRAMPYEDHNEGHYKQDEHNDYQPKEGHKDDEVVHRYGHADIPDYGDHYQKDYTVYSPKSSYHSSIPLIKSAQYSPKPMIKSNHIEAWSASFKPYFPPIPSYKSSQHVASWATPTAVSKRTMSSKFVDPFATPTKEADGAFVPIVPYTPTKASEKSKITPAPSKGFSTLAAGNSTGPRTTLSLFNACSGMNATCASLRDITYFASVVTAAPSSTIFAIDCSQKGRNGTTACFNKAMTVTQGPSMFARVDDSKDVPKTVSCNIIGRTASAVCTETYRPTAAVASGIAPKSSGNATVAGKSFEFQGAQVYYNDLVVTAGVEKLSASRTPTGPSSKLTVRLC